MIVEYDEKGKYYTDVISKDIVFSHIQTQSNQIHGFVHVRKGERLSDEVNETTPFLAVTNAEICSQQGEVLHTSKFLLVNRSHIIWLMPIDGSFENPQPEGEN